MGASKYIHIGRINFLAKTAYMGDLLLGTTFYTLILFVFVQLWRVLGGPSGLVVEGFGYREMVWYLTASEAIMLGRARIQDDISDEVKTGAIAYSLGRPYHYLGFKFACYWGETAVRMLVHIAVGIAIALLAVGPIQVTAVQLGALAVSVTLALILNFLIVACISLLAFWVEDTVPFFWIYGKLLFVLGGLFAPVELYPEALARAARASPFNYVLYVPARMLVRFDAAAWGNTISAQLGWIAVLGALAVGLYSLGVRRLNVNGG